MNSARVLGGTEYFNRQLAVRGNTDALKALRLSDSAALKALEIFCSAIIIDVLIQRDPLK